LTGLLTVQSGGPLTIVAGKDQSGTALSNDRAWYVGGVDPYGGNGCGTKAPCVNYLNPAFNLSPEGSRGNVEKGSLRSGLDRLMIAAWPRTSPCGASA
jgi:hypothetical protein